MDDNFRLVIDALVKVNQPELKKEMEALKRNIKTLPIEVRLDLGKAMKEAQSKLRNQSTRAGAQEVLEMGSKLATSHVGKTKAEMQSVVETMNQLNAANIKTANSTKQVQRSLDDTGKSSKGLGDKLSSAVQQFAFYQIAIRGMYEALSQLRLGIQYIKDLDKEMTAIQMVTGESDAKINALALSYNKLGKEMGVSTLEIAKGSLEFVRQGKTAEETAILIENSTKMSKLGNMDAAASSEAMTSIMNGFKMSVEETGAVVDKLVAIDNTAATSVAELANAMQYTSSASKMVGIDFEHLAAYIGTISSVTRLSSESIGQSMKTIMLRMTAIKDMKAFDSEGEAINKVEGALMGVGVKLRDANGEFRDLQDVLDELAANWDSFSKENQMFIAQQIGGVRQADKLLALLSNQAEIQKQLNAERSSSGLADERYQVSLNSVEAAQNKMSASWEKMVSTTMNSGMIEFFYQVASALFNLISAIGGLAPVLITAGLAYVAFANQITFSSITAGLAATSLMGILDNLFGTIALSMVTNPVGWFIIAAGAILMIANAIPTAQERLDKLNESILEHQKKISDLQNTKKDILNLADEYKKLKEEFDRTGKSSQEFIDVQNKIHQLIPSVAGEFDEYGNFIINATADMDNLTAATQKQIDKENELLQIELDKSAKSSAKNLQSLFDQSQSEGVKYSGGFHKFSDEEKLRNELAYLDALENEKSRFRQMGSEAQQEYLAGLTGDLRNVFLTEFWGTLKEVTDKMSKDDPVVIPVKPEITDEELVTAISGVQDKLKSMDEILLQIGQGNISADLITKLKDLGVSAEFVNGQIVISQEEMDKFYASMENGISDTYALTDAQKALADSQLGSSQMLVYGTEMSRGAFVNMATDMANTIFGVDEQVRGSLYDIHGTLLSTSEQLAAAFTSDYANFVAIISQMSQKGIIDAAQFKSLIGQYGTYSTGLTPYKPDSSTMLSPMASGGGGGGSGKSAEQTRLEKEIKGLNDKKKALQKLIDEFKKYIAAQKEILKLAKEQAAFEDSLLKKNQDLAKLKSEIAVLALDDSEEARAKRLQLEEEAANLEVDISQDQEDRKYQLQIDALDKAQKDYEDSIKAQMDGIDDTIAKYQEQSSAIQGSGGAVGGVSNKTKELGAITAEVGQEIVNWYAKQAGLSDLNKNKLQEQVNKWVEQGMAIDEASLRAMRYADILARIESGKLSNVNAYETTSANRDDDAYWETHHEGGFAGGLKSNEVYSKLIKGEFIETEADMNNFLTRILPSMLTSPAVTKTGGSAGDISVSMPINVNGNMDKTVIPSLEKIAEKVMAEINKTMQGRGYTRRADSFSI